MPTYLDADQDRYSYQTRYPPRRQNNYQPDTDNCLSDPDIHSDFGVNENEWNSEWMQPVEESHVVIQPTTTSVDRHFNTVPFRRNFTEE